MNVAGALDVESGNGKMEKLIFQMNFFLPTHFDLQIS